MTRQFFKHNNLQAIENIIPKFYFESDIELSGLRIKPEDVLINTHLVFANNFSSIINVSAVSSSPITSALDSLLGIAPYFVKQNRLTNITPFGFENDILIPLGYNFGSFSTSALFKAYVSDTLLPSIQLNYPIASLAATIEDTHIYLTSKLGWFYFLNFSGTPYSPSAYVADKFTDLYFGKSLGLNDGMKGLTTFLWNNYTACAVINNKGLIPGEYTSGVEFYTSGTQQLSKLNTLIDVVYSPLVIDKDDYYVRTAFEDYISSQLTLQNLESNGPFTKFVKALSYFFHDLNDDVERINKIYDLDQCPDELLPYVADLIGWKLYGHDANRWRLQLRSATSIYKAKGTKKAIQLAVDSIFSENFLNISGVINELYESYIPHLIYYSLATESPLLSSFGSWTPQKAAALGVDGYSTQSMDTNIRFVVDNILHSLVRTFPSYFRLGKVVWDINDPNFIFNYRGRNFNIPPFEEYKFWKDLEITEAMIYFVADRLSCYGVPDQFVVAFITFIIENVLDTEELTQLDNRWLFFYTGLKRPYNYDSLLSDFNKSKFDYMGLWSAKSSHFNLNLFASNFVFDQRSLTTSSTLALQEALQVVNDFSPAHAIPDINILLTDEDIASYEEFDCPGLDNEGIELYSGSGFVPGFHNEGTNMSSLSAIFSRADVDNLNDVGISSLLSLTNLPRNSIRRRSYHNLLPKGDLYTRTGFNMPMVNLVSSVEHYGNGLGFQSLGFIPSTLMYTPINEISAIPGVYSRCETLNSSSLFNGVTTSDTYPIRGYDSLEVSACKRYAVRGDTDPIFWLMNKILYYRDIDIWSNYLSTSTGWSLYKTSAADYDLPTSLANSNLSISSFNQYDNFSFKRGIHQIYNDWIEYFGMEQVNIASLDLSGGKDIFSHTFGPLIYNGKFDQFGSAISVSSNLIASAYGEIVSINNNSGQGILSFAGSTVGTFVASGSPQSNLNIRNEFRNKDILNNIELVNTSGASLHNKFEIFNIHPVFTQQGFPNYFIDNPAIKQKAVNGFSRMIFHFSSVTNSFMPEHEFNLKVKYFGGFDTGVEYGGQAIGAWIHTEPQNGAIWNWTPNNKWEYFPIPSAVTLNTFVPFFHTKAQPLLNIPQNLVSGFVGECFNSNTGQVAKLNLNSIISDLFDTLEINFNTLNYSILLPSEYYRYFGQVNKFTQNYVIEIFKLANGNNNSYVIFDEVNIIDSTENMRAEELIPEDLLIALHYFKGISDDRASRVVGVTEGNYNTSGGSRINYRVHPEWGTFGKNSNFQLSSLSITN